MSWFKDRTNYTILEVVAPERISTNAMESSPATTAINDGMVCCQTCSKQGDCHPTVSNHLTQYPDQTSKHVRVVSTGPGSGYQHPFLGSECKLPGIIKLLNPDSIIFRDGSSGRITIYLA